MIFDIQKLQVVEFFELTFVLTSSEPIRFKHPYPSKPDKVIVTATNFGNCLLPGCGRTSSDKFAPPVKAFNNDLCFFIVSSRVITPVFVFYHISLLIYI